jgi:hypothetical protein
MYEFQHLVPPKQWRANWQQNVARSVIATQRFTEQISTYMIIDLFLANFS